MCADSAGIAAAVVHVCRRVEQYVTAPSCPRQRSGTRLKVYIAAAAATAEQAFEVSLLDSALGLLQSSLLDALPAVWAATGQASRDAFDAQQMRNATCLCAAAETLLVKTPFHNPATYAAANCSGEGPSCATMYAHQVSRLQAELRLLLLSFVLCRCHTAGGACLGH